MATRKGTSLDGAKGSTRSDKVRITDLINLYKFPEKKWVVMRLSDGEMHSYATGWVRGKTKEGKPIKFPVNIRCYDPETQEFDSTIYDPWYELYQSEKGVERDSATIQLGRKFYLNAISRQSQKQKPSTIHKPTAGEKESGFKEKDSDTWTPWVPVALPPSVIDKLKELKGLNVVESKKTGASKTYSVAHERFGCDIRILYDSSKPPAQQYEVQLGDRRPLTDEEKAGLKWDTSGLAEESDEKSVKADFESWAKRMGIGLNKSKKAKGRSEDDEDDDSYDEDDDEPKSKKSKASSKSKKRPEPEDDEDEDEDEDDAGLDDEDADDEEDTPPPKSKKSSSSKSKAKSKRDEDDDEEDEEDEEDDDLDEDDDEEDEPVTKGKSKASASASAKSKASSKSKKRPEPEDEEDDEDEDDDLDDDEDDDEEEDTPPPKSKKASGKASTAVKASSKSKKRPDPDEDDDEDEDEDEDEDDDLDDDEEDEEDTPPPKSKKTAGKASASSTKKRK